MIKLKIIPTPRAKMGWPCFYCGKGLKYCRSKRKLKCCKQCKGGQSH